MTNDPYSTRKVRQLATKNADQVESAAFILGSAPVGTGLFDERIAGALDQYEPLDVDAFPDGELVDTTLDSAVGLVNEEIERRVSLMEDAYPFVLDRGTLRYRAVLGAEVYLFLLAICLSPSITTGANRKFPRVFERIAGILVQEYLGVNSEHLHTGWPRDGNERTRLKGGMAGLAERSANEWIWRPEENLPDDPHPKIEKDCGIDFVAWKKSPDLRTGFLFFLGQCACGDNWLDKYGDIKIKRIEKWFKPMAHVDPVRTFAIPFHIVDEMLVEATKDAGLVFDRARLAILAHRDGALETLQPYMANMKELSDMYYSEPVS